jgi:pimeloyl-ACP methyl ester carboxylesterase
VATGVSEAARRAAPRRAEPSQEEQGLSAVVLVGGFGLPATYLRPLARRLDASVASLGFNVDCGERSVQRLLEQLGPGSTVVGHSRGGQLARVAAVRRPDLVSRLVTVGTPWSIGPPDRAGVAAMTSAVRAVRRRGVDVLASVDCADGECCADYRRDVVAKPAARWTAIWSSADTVSGNDGRPPAVADEAVDVPVSHLGLVRSTRGIDAIAAVLT